MKSLLLLSFLCSSLGQVLRISVFDRIGIMPGDFLAIILFFLYVISVLKEKKNVLNIKFFLPVFFFFSWALFTLIFSIGNLGLNTSESFLGLAYFGRTLAYFSYLFIFMDIIKNKKELIFWKNIFFISLFIIVLLGFFQLKLFPSFYELRMHETGWDPHIGRMLSTWFDPNYLGGFFAFCIPFIASEIKKTWQIKNKKQSFLLLGLLVITLIAIMMTFSRSALLALLVSGFIFALLVDRRLILIGGIIIAISLISSERLQERSLDAIVSAKALFTESEKTLDPTARLRIKSWQIGWKLGQQFPITGVGFNNLKTVQKKEWSMMSKSHAGSGVDSSLLTVFASSGYLGLMFFIYFYLKIFAEALGAKGKNKLWNQALIASLCGLFAHAVFVNSMFFSLFLPFLFLSIAIAQKKYH